MSSFAAVVANSRPSEYNSRARSSIEALTERLMGGLANGKSSDAKGYSQVGGTIDTTNSLSCLKNGMPFINNLFRFDFVLGIAVRASADGLKVIFVKSSDESYEADEFLRRAYIKFVAENNEFNTELIVLVKNEEFPSYADYCYSKSR